MTVRTLTGIAQTISLFFVSLSLLLFLSPALFAAENDAVVGTCFTSGEMVRGVPPGWVLDKKSGTVNLRLEKEGEGFVVRLASDRNASFGIKRGLRVDLRQYPFLNWRWKAGRLPRGGDVREAETDDQAVQLYVAFPPTGFPAVLNTPVLGYVWDNEAPRGWTGRSDQIGGAKLRYLVVRNKDDRLGEWYTEKRNLAQDSKKLLGDLKGVDFVTHGIELYINSQRTKSEAEGWIGDVFFSRN
jgi:hypothetical protein